MENPNLEKCLEVLSKARSDNEHFAALLLVTKVVKAEDCDEVTRRRIFDSIGFAFLKRLLRSGVTPEGVDDNMYKSIAVTILSCFSTDQHLAVHSQMTSLLPEFNDLITSFSSQSEKEMDRQIVGDCYDIITAMAAQSLGRSNLLQRHTVNALCEAYTQHSEQQAIDILLYLVRQCGGATWQDNTYGLHLLLNHLAQYFKQEQDEKKFDLCRTLRTVLTTVQQDECKGAPCSWRWDMHSALADILQSKTGAEQREPALKLCSILIGLFGVTWCLSADQQHQKFLLLVVHLTCIEVRMTLEDKEFLQVVAEADLLSCCYGLLESVIAYMTAGPSLCLEDKQIRQLHSAMMGAFNSVIFFLSNVSSQHPDRCMSPVVCASVRVLGSWLAEETTALKEEVYLLLPFLIQISRDTFQETKDNQPSSTGQDSSQTKPRGEEQSENSVEGAMEMESGKSMMLVPAGTEFPKEQPVTDLFKFLLPALCHLTAEDQSRSILIQQDAHTLLQEYFLYQWQAFTQRGRSREAEVALTTLCGSLLNLCVLEPQLVSRDSAFQALTTQVINALPIIVYDTTQLVLSMNLAVLGLMLLRHQASSIGVSDGDLDSFLAAVVYLLSHIHQRAPGQTKGAKAGLVISDMFCPIWDQVSELAFLGMQVLTACISLVPRTSGAILRGGWIPSITKLLLAVHGGAVDTDAVSLYGELLSEVAQHSPPARQVLVEKDGVRLARLYKMDQLSKILTS